MLIATNRCIVPAHVNGDLGDEFAFGEDMNPKGANELRFAHATKDQGAWQVRIVPEPGALSADNLPSHDLFEQLARKCSQSGTHCLFYVHGYDKPFAETLEQGWLLQERYGVEVVLFSWPSNTGGFPLFEYRQARRVAQASFGALDALFEKYGRYLNAWMTRAMQQGDERSLLACRSTTNLMAHSLGSYLLEHYVLSQAYQAETRLFSNVVLSQADVNSVDHVKWVDKVAVGQRLYVTINENDKILGWSEALNPPRLGKTLANLDSRRALYVDFTAARGVRTKHQLWGEVRNATVSGFFGSVFKGQRGETTPGLAFDSTVGAWRAA
jgi:esterase/lipase superfamily enzyme